MSKGKLKRKYKQKQKRLKKILRGKFVRFDLQNSSRKYAGFKNKYCYQTNIHRLIYKDASFENVRYQASNITQCNFKKTKLRGVDFCNTNLKGTSFKRAILKDVVFINCNLKGVDFTDAKFYNTYFIMTNIDVCKEIIVSEECTIIKQYPTNIDLNDIGETALFRLSEIKKIYKYHVLHVSLKKINMWVLKILFDQYGQDVNRALGALERRKDKRFFFTVSTYMHFIEDYLKL